MHTREGKRLGAKLQYGGFPSRIFGLPCFNCAPGGNPDLRGGCEARIIALLNRLELAVSKLFQHSSMHKSILRMDENDKFRLF